MLEESRQKQKLERDDSGIPSEFPMLSHIVPENCDKNKHKIILAKS